MKLPPPVDPSEPLIIDHAIGGAARAWLVQLQKRASTSNHAILGAQLSHPTVGRRPGLAFLHVAIGPVTPTRADAQPLLIRDATAEHSLDIKGKLTHLLVDDVLLNVTKSPWSASNTVIAPRGYLAAAIAAGRGVVNEALTRHLIQATFSGRGVFLERAAPRIPGRKSDSLLHGVLAFCANEGHRLEYLATDFNQNAVAVVHGSHDAILDVAVKTSFKEWYEKPHEVSTRDGTFKVDVRLAPIDRNLAKLYLPSVLYGPFGATKELFETGTTSSLAPEHPDGRGLLQDTPHPREVTFLRRAHVVNRRAANGANVADPAPAFFPPMVIRTRHFMPESSFFHVLEHDTTPARHAQAALTIAPHWLYRSYGPIKDPSAWMQDLERSGHSGVTLARLIRMEYVANVDRHSAVRAIRASQLHYMPQPTQSAEQLQLAIETALANPPVPDHHPQQSREKLQPPRNEFRL